MDYILDLEGNKVLIEAEQKAMKQNLAEQYVRMRKEKKMTQEQVSQRSGIPRSNIARFESGRYNPSLELMVKMAAAMGMKVQIQLVPDENAKA
ncbi:MAG: helix-turn-helix transcriptional regulator [Lachnospiraceae bacterium]|nr:helix-turn-helix transcriptional regulator [Lachnospiraceae bacterium]